jgi:type II secretory pathway pseudopilin PulG
MKLNAKSRPAEQGCQLRHPDARTRTSSTAFTLLEIMLAIGIFTMVLMSIYSSWSAMVRGAKTAQDAAAAVQRSRVAVRALQDALMSAQVFNANPQHYWFVADTTGEFAMLDMVACLPESFPGSGLFGDIRLRHVSFKVEPDDSGQYNLILRQWALLSPTNMPGGEPYTIVLGRDVDLFKLEFLDPVKKDWVDEWKYTNYFPPLVLVAIGMGNRKDLPAEKREIIRRVIAPVNVVVPREWQLPGLPGPGGRMMGMPPVPPNTPLNMPPQNPMPIVPPAM